MTPRQKDVLDFIAERLAETAIAPSFEEIRLHLGLASKSGVHRIVDALVEQGKLNRRPGRTRALEIGPGAQFNPLASFTTDALWAELESRGALNG